MSISLMSRILRIVVPAVLMSVGASTANAQTSDRADGMRFIPNVHEQFASLTERPEALGFHIDGTPDPSFCKHYQGIVRVDGADGTPFFLLTRSGNTPGTTGSGIVCDDSDGERGFGNLVVVRMGSRDKNGERLRSNRLRKGVHQDETPPPPEDHATKFFTVTENGLVPGYGGSTAPPRIYQHPGGMQVIGHMLAMAMGTRTSGGAGYEIASSPSLVMFFDISNPENPVLKSKFAPIDTFGNQLDDADAIAITALPGGYYLMVISAGFDNSGFFFYRSTLANSAANPNVLTSPQLSWEYVAEIGNPGTEDAHQSLHFLREGSIDGTLYLAGSRGHPLLADHDRIDLYRLAPTTPDFDPHHPGGQNFVLIPEINSRRITVFQNTGGGPKADLAAAAGFYESPSGELLFYATQHQNEGPQGSGDSATVNAGEWRHINVVRDNSPTYLPTAAVGGPYVVDEGSSITLTGTAGPPITKAWIELFSDRNYGGEHFATHYPVIDYDDRDKDDFDHFGTLEYQDLQYPYSNFNLSDQASSWKWFAPVGCSIYAMDHIGSVLDEARTLIGDGSVHSDTDLSQVQNDGCGNGVEDEIDAVEFRTISNFSACHEDYIHVSGCDAYYTAPFDLYWDLDLNGTYGTIGNSVTFNARGFDGPSVVAVPAQARAHSGSGAAGQATARVTIRNVAPRLTQFRLTDGAGNVLNVAVPFVLTKLPVTVSASFSDPGLLDHQTATLAWGDALVESQTDFTAFHEAFGSGTGALTDTHRYALAGSYPLALSVMDDDGGVDTRSAVVRVLTPEQAVQELVGLLDSAIASTTDNTVRGYLEKARKALAGSNGVSNDGALNKIKTGNKQAAITFLRQAIDWLRKAQAGGANVATLIALLEQVMAALSAA